MLQRKMTRVVNIGGVAVGGGNPVAVQSMTNTKTEDAEATIRQILRLEEAGCDIVRVTVPTFEAAEAVAKIRAAIRIPLVADIHFDYRMAIAAMEHGADKISINPGNLGDDEKLKAVVSCAKERKKSSAVSRSLTVNPLPTRVWAGKIPNAWSKNLPLR